MRRRGPRLIGLMYDIPGMSCHKKIPALRRGPTNQIPSQNYSSHSEVYTKIEPIWISGLQTFFEVVYTHGQHRVDLQEKRVNLRDNWLFPPLIWS
jgi:hypothetical protein